MAENTRRSSPSGSQGRQRKSDDDDDEEEEESDDDDDDEEESDDDDVEGGCEGEDACDAAQSAEKICACAYTHRPFECLLHSGLRCGAGRDFCDQKENLEGG